MRQPLEPDKSLHLALDEAGSAALGSFSSGRGVPKFVLQHFEQLGFRVKARLKPSGIFLKAGDARGQFHVARIAPEEGGQARIAFSPSNRLQLRSDLKQAGANQAQIKACLKVSIAQLSQLEPLNIAAHQGEVRKLKAKRLDCDRVGQGGSLRKCLNRQSFQLG